MNISREDLERVIEIKIEIDRLDKNDTNRDEIIESGSYAIAEGYMTPNMRRIEKLEEKLDAILSK